jgi:REP element-mobilizing transposase RayT
MPRGSRIDAAGAVQHIMVRGIERAKIFESDADRDQLIQRLSDILSDTKTTCYAWSLMPNHFHLLLRTGETPISTVMRRLLTGYAVRYNLRHRRTGHLFQNRFKSVLCQEDAYLLELVRYIHLNPMRAGVVKNLKELDRYPYSGHSFLMGTLKNTWQEIDGILIMFGKRRFSARQAYRSFVEKGIEQGRRPELSGGGLIRSAGGWEALKALKREKTYQRSDERILGDGDFVNRVLAEAREALEKRHALRAEGSDLNNIAFRVSELMGVKPEDVWAKCKYPRIVDARGLFCYWAVRELGVSMADMARQLGLSIPAISKSVRRGQQISESQGFRLIDS